MNAVTLPADRYLQIVAQHTTIDQRLVHQD